MVHFNPASVKLIVAHISYVPMHSKLASEQQVCSAGMRDQYWFLQLAAFVTHDHSNQKNNDRIIIRRPSLVIRLCYGCKCALLSDAMYPPHYC